MQANSLIKSSVMLVSLEVLYYFTIKCNEFYGTKNYYDKNLEFLFYKLYIVNRIVFLMR